MSQAPDDATVVGARRQGTALAPSVLAFLSDEPTIERGLECAMVPQSLEERVDMLEQQMKDLRALPARVDRLTSQVLQIRKDLGVATSAIRGEIAGLGTALRAEMKAQSETLRGEMKAQADTARREMKAQADTLQREMKAQAAALRGEVKAGDASLGATLRKEMKEANASLAATLRKEIRDGDEETRRLMRVLHEDLVGRMALLAEGRSPAPGQSRVPKRRTKRSNP